VKYNKQALLFVFIIILLIIIVYFQTFSHQLIYLDDETLLQKRFVGLDFWEKIRLSFTSNYLGGHYYRPMALVTLITDSLMSGKGYFIYHLSNIFIHLFTCIFLFLVLKRMNYSNIVSFFSVTFFAINPININAIGWIAGRGDLLAGLFATFALLILLLYINKNNPLLISLVSILLFLAILSKEVSLLVPILFLLFYITEKKDSRLNKSSIAVLLMLISIFSAYYLLRGVLQSEVHIDKFSFSALINNISILPETVSKFFIPLGIKALPRFEYFTTISGIILFLFLVLLPIKLTSINRLRYYFGLLWFILLLIPGMVNRTMEQDGLYYWDCRSYLPLIGLVIIISEIIRTIELKNTKNIYYAVLVIYSLILGAFSFQKIKMYESPITFWTSVKADYPTHFLPYIGLYNYYNDEKDFSDAEIQLLEAINKNRKDISLRIILNNFYLVNNMKQKSLVFLRTTINEIIKVPDSLLRTYIALAIDLNSFNDIELLFTTYSDEQSKINEIHKILEEDIEFLKNNNNQQKAELLERKLGE
jgi:hypothetical protein